MSDDPTRDKLVRAALAHETFGREDTFLTLGRAADASRAALSAARRKEESHEA